MSTLRCLTLLILSLFLISISQIVTVGDDEPVRSHASDASFFFLDPQENIGHFLKVRDFAWAFAKNKDPEHDGWFSVWAEVDRDRDRDSGDYDGILDAWAYKEQDRYIWQNAPQTFHSSFVN